MPLVSGPSTGLTVNLTSGFSGEAGIGIGGNGTFASAFATNEWLLQDTSSPLAANVGAETLANDTGLLNQEMTGFSGGATRQSWLGDSADDSLVSSGTSAGDSDSADIAIRFIFSQTLAGVSGRYYAAKRPSAAGAGWAILQHSSGALQFVVGDGTNTASVLSARTVWNDGLPHEIAVWYDESADLIYIKGDDSAEVSADSSAVTGSLTNAGSLIVNSYRVAGSNGIIGTRRCYFGVSVGVSAGDFYDETVVL